MSAVTGQAALRNTLAEGSLAPRPGTDDNGAMEIILNGVARPLVTSLSLSQLLADEGLADRRVAVEVNGEIVPRGQHQERRLVDGDRVEIVHALGGG